MPLTQADLDILRSELIEADRKIDAVVAALAPAAPSPQPVPMPTPTPTPVPTPPTPKPSTFAKFPSCAQTVNAKQLTYKGWGRDGGGLIRPYEAWLFPLKTNRLWGVLDFAGFADWADWHGTTFNALNYVWGKMPSLQLVWTLGLTVEGVGLWDIAGGKHDAEFKKAAQSMLAAFPSGNVIIRLGHEMNGGWYPWSGQRNGINKATGKYWYVEAFRRVVGIFRTVSPNWRFDWNPTIGNLGVPVEQLYPGDDVVDVIGLDVYNEFARTGQFLGTATETAKQSWDERTLGLPQNYGLLWHDQFAKAHNKPLSFPEWGTGVRPNRDGRGDDPYFIQQMKLWMEQRADRIAYHCYWDVPADDFDCELSGIKSRSMGHTPIDLPLAREQFLKLFGG